MSKPKRHDPVVQAKRAARRKARREAEAQGVEHLPRKPRPSAQMDHGSNPKGTKHAREGEAAMRRDRGES